MVEVKKILFPCDLTENSSKILPYVLTVAEKFNAAVFLLHVVRDLKEWEMSYLPTPPLKEFHEESMDAARKLIDQVCEKQLQSCPNFQKKVVAGDPSIEILKFIESEGMDLVIMGTHGRKGLEHTFFGSVAENIVKKSPVPVLTINPYKLKK